MTWTWKKMDIHTLLNYTLRKTFPASKRSENLFCEVLPHLNGVKSKPITINFRIQLKDSRNNHKYLVFGLYIHLAQCLYCSSHHSCSNTCWPFWLIFNILWIVTCSSIKSTTQPIFSLSSKDIIVEVRIGWHHNRLPAKMVRNKARYKRTPKKYRTKAKRN